jgi:hypothetical protein
MDVMRTLIELVMKRDQSFEVGSIRMMRFMMEKGYQQDLTEKQKKLTPFYFKGSKHDGWNFIDREWKHRSQLVDILFSAVLNVCRGLRPALRTKPGEAWSLSLLKIELSEDAYVLQPTEQSATGGSAAVDLVGYGPAASADMQKVPSSSSASLTAHGMPLWTPAGESTTAGSSGMPVDIHGQGSSSPSAELQDPQQCIQTASVASIIALEELGIFDGVISGAVDLSCVSYVTLRNAQIAAATGASVDEDEEEVSNEAAVADAGDGVQEGDSSVIAGRSIHRGSSAVNPGPVAAAPSSDLDPARNGEPPFTQSAESLPQENVKESVAVTKTILLPPKLKEKRGVPAVDVTLPPPGVKMSLASGIGHISHCNRCGKDYPFGASSCPICTEENSFELKGSLTAVPVPIYGDRHFQTVQAYSDAWEPLVQPIIGKLVQGQRVTENDQVRNHPCLTTI